MNPELDEVNALGPWSVCLMFTLYALWVQLTPFIVTRSHLTSTKPQPSVLYLARKTKSYLSRASRGATQLMQSGLDKEVMYSWQRLD